MQKTSLKFAQLKVGLTIFIGLVIFFAFIFLIGNEGNYFGSKYNLNIFLENSEGLSGGSMVSLGGIKVGSVSDLEFKKRNGKNGITITLSISNDYKPKITASSSASIKTIGLLGDKFVDISLGQADEQSLEEGEFLPVEPSIGFDKLSREMEPALDDFSKLLFNLRIISDTISEGKGSIGKLLNDQGTAEEIESVLINLNRFTTALNNGKGSLGNLVYDTSLYHNFNNLSDNLAEIVSSIKDGKGSLGKFLLEDSVYYSITSISGRLDKVISKAEGDSTLIGGIINDKKMYNELNSTITELNQLINEIKTQPEKYLHISVF